MTACSILVTFCVMEIGVEVTEGCPPSVGVIPNLKKNPNLGFMEFLREAEDLGNFYPQG